MVRGLCKDGFMGDAKRAADTDLKSYNDQVSDVCQNYNFRHSLHAFHRVLKALIS